LTAIFPVKGGRCIVLDIGTNPECKPEHLLQFAIMGSIYSRAIHGVDSPRIGLLSMAKKLAKGTISLKVLIPCWRPAV